MFLKKLLSLIFLSTTIYLSSEIVESDDFSVVMEHCEEDTLLVCDLDNTLIESSQHLGSISWKDYILFKSENCGHTKKESEEMQAKFWQFIQPFLRARLVEDSIQNTLVELKKKGVSVLAITERHPEEFAHTKKQLNSVNLKMSSFGKKRSISVNEPALYSKGILFCGNNKKTQSLISFLKTLKKAPKKIVYIDDLAFNIVEVNNFFKNEDTPCVAIRYAKTDERCDNFSPFVSDLQWYVLPKYLSDEDAYKMLNQKLADKTAKNN